MGVLLGREGWELVAEVPWRSPWLGFSLWGRWWRGYAPEIVQTDPELPGAIVAGRLEDTVEVVHTRWEFGTD